jgi:hypothetical protein
LPASGGSDPGALPPGRLPAQHPVLQSRRVGRSAGIHHQPAAMAAAEPRSFFPFSTLPLSNSRIQSSACRTGNPAHTDRPGGGS